MASSSSSEVKTVRLRGSDGETLEVPESAITAASATIKSMIDERRAAADGVVEIPNLTAATLSRVVTYVKKHFGSGGANPAADDYHSTFVPSDDDPLACFDHKLVNVDNEALFDLIEAAEYLSIEKLLDLACKAVADQMRGRPLEEIRKTFNIVNDYTEEEEDEVRRENTWAFQSTV